MVRRSNFKLCSWIGHMILRVLVNISYDIDPKIKVKGQILNFLGNASPPKAFDVVTSNSVSA